MDRRAQFVFLPLCNSSHEWREGNGICDTSPEVHFFLLFKSPSVQISSCSIIINVEEKEA